MLFIFVIFYMLSGSILIYLNFFDYPTRTIKIVFINLEELV